MGITTIRAHLANLVDRTRQTEIDMIVDSGAIYSVVPATMLRGIGVIAERTETFWLADGREVKRQIGNAVFTIDGSDGISKVIFGRRDDDRLTRPRDPDERIYRAVMRIPPGRVATYGQIARVAGMPRHHRQVGRALRQLVDDGLVPWHRVVGADGRISPRSGDGVGESIQRERLEDEGVVFDARGRVPLGRFQWARRATEKPGRGR